MVENKKIKKLDDYKKQLLAFEELLLQFSYQAQFNYYINKVTLEIYIDDELGYLDGGYNSYKNIINLSDENVLLHEIAHMAFNNKNEINKKISSKYIKKNGIIFKFKKDYYGKGINEGFAESLARRAGKIPNTRSFEAYIVNLLVSIYGDEIYEFPLKNDPIGFYNYCSENIINLVTALDTYTNSFEYAASVVYDMNKNKKLSKRFVRKSLSCFEATFPSAIINSIISIINEYNCCDNPRITRLEFKKEIENLFDDENFKEVDKFLMTKFIKNLRQEIEEIIDTELMAKKYIK